jgi:hypothetical protein
MELKKVAAAMAVTVRVALGKQEENDMAITIKNGRQHAGSCLTGQAAIGREHIGRARRLGKNDGRSNWAQRLITQGESASKKMEQPLGSRCSALSKKGVVCPKTGRCLSRAPGGIRPEGQPGDLAG